SANELGISGTPYNIVLGSNGERFAVAGAFPEEFFDIVIAAMQKGTPRAATAIPADDIESIYNFVITNNALPTITGDTTANMLPIDEADHIRGDANAPIVIVEYSDLECPYCQRHHETMLSLVDKYGSDVAWVYRHL